MFSFQSNSFCEDFVFTVISGQFYHSDIYKKYKNEL